MEVSLRAESLKSEDPGATQLSNEQGLGLKLILDFNPSIHLSRATQ